MHRRPGWHSYFLTGPLVSQRRRHHHWPVLFTQGEAAVSARATSGSENGGPSAARQSIASTPDPPARLLVVEDEDKGARALQEGLEGEGYEVAVERTGEGAFFRLNTEPFDLVLLDVMLPGRDGLQILTTLRERGVIAPVLLLTARDTLEDRVDGLNRGADDYLVKPFAFAEVLARTRALLRRGRGAVEAVRLASSDLEMNLVKREVTRGGGAVELTVREFELLEYLLRHEGQVVSREALALDVWKETARSTPLDNVIDVHIARLRRKIHLDRPTKLIHTVRGIGFVLRPEQT